MQCLEYNYNLERFKATVASNSCDRVSYKLACLLKKMGYCEKASMYYFIDNPFGEPISYHYKNGESNVRIAAPLLDEICDFILTKTRLTFDIDSTTKQYIIGHEAVSSKECFFAISVDKYPPVTGKEAVQKAFIKICTMYLKCKKTKLELP